jgi:hypothetical protein
MPPTSMPDLDAETERKLAAGLYNEVWRFIELESRTAEQTDEMIHTAHASRYHWGRVGSVVNLARGEWMCARAYAVAGRAEPSLWHARRCLALLEGAAGAEDWDLAGAYEGLARASALAGDEVAAKDWLARGHEAAAAIADPEDRKPIEADLDSLG